VKTLTYYYKKFKVTKVVKNALTAKAQSTQRKIYYRKKTEDTNNDLRIKNKIDVYPVNPV